MSDIKKFLVNNILQLNVQYVEITKIELYGMTIKKLDELYYVLLAFKEITENEEITKN
tara:strand:- start:2098 stop:2271 length:174 start_codon:yes stop_codon:yes gene_type:complete